MPADYRTRLATPDDASLLSEMRRLMFTGMGKPDDDRMQQVVEAFIPWVADAIRREIYIGWIVDTQRRNAGRQCGLVAHRVAAQLAGPEPSPWICHERVDAPGAPQEGNRSSLDGSCHD